MRSRVHHSCPSSLQPPSEQVFCLITIARDSCRPRPSEHLAKIAAETLERFCRDRAGSTALCGDVFHPSALEIIDLARLV